MTRELYHATFVLFCFNKLLHWLLQFCERIIFFQSNIKLFPRESAAWLPAVTSLSQFVVILHQFFLLSSLHWELAYRMLPNPLTVLDKASATFLVRFVSFDTMSSVVCVCCSVSKWLSCVFTACLALLQRDTRDANLEYLKIHGGAVKSWKNTVKPNLPFSISSADM